MNATEILYIGVNGRVIALNKYDGTKIWQTDLRRSFHYSGNSYVAVLVDGERVYAHTYGELFCLDGRTGEQLWTNRLPGLGYELATIAVAGISTQLQAMEYLKNMNSGAG